MQHEFLRGDSVRGLHFDEVDAFWQLLQVECDGRGVDCATDECLSDEVDYLDAAHVPGLDGDAVAGGVGEY